MAIVLYARKSVERENSISCDTQLEYCKSALRPDERNDEIISIVDNGFSGGNVNRKGFQKMMKLVEQGRVSKVVVYRLDRISRSMLDFVNILQKFKDYNVKFLSSQEVFDTSTPYGEMVVKILMIFAEFERTSTITRVTQAYAHRSEMGFYMGGRQPYGFQLVPAVINNIRTKKLEAVPEEAEQIRYIFEVYAQENVSLRRLLDILVTEGRKPLNGSDWTTAKLSAILKNPIYVRADSDVYDYFEHHGVHMVTDCSEFTGEFGAQLYGKTKHKRNDPDWSDMKLVLLTHQGLVSSDIWLKCQRKLEQNKQIHKSVSNQTSWLAGKIFCEKCGHSMTTIKGKINRNGEMRRYFNCTGKSLKRKCSGPEATIYAEELENMVYGCITEKLNALKDTWHAPAKGDSPEINELKLRIKEIEKSEQTLVDTMLSGRLNDAMLDIMNAKAAALKKSKSELYDRIDSIRASANEAGAVIDLARSWKNADYDRKKAVASIMVQKIIIGENGNVRIIWNI